MIAPRSRKERKAATRERLLDVAAEILSESGYLATSLDRIAEAAGYSKGAVYSNFSGKEELVLEVLDRQFMHRLDDLGHRLAEVPMNAEDRFEALIGWWEDMLYHDRWIAVIFEFAGATRDNREMRDQLASRQRMVIDHCTRLIDAESERFGLTPELTPAELAGMLASLGQGLSFTRALVSGVSPEIFTKVARLLLLGSDVESTATPKRSV